MGRIAIKTTLEVVWEEPGRLTVDEYLHNDAYADGRERNFRTNVLVEDQPSFGKEVLILLKRRLLWLLCFSLS